MGLAAGAILGHYELSPSDLTPNCVMGQTFGNDLTESGERVPGPVNETVAGFVIDQLVDVGDVPLLLQREVAVPFTEQTGEEADLVISEHRIPGRYLDSMEVIDQCYSFMRARLGPEERIVPLIASQAFHAGRIAVQSRLFGMEPVLRPGLPRTFNPGSTQRWTRSRGLWAIRELGLVIPMVSIKRAKKALTGKV